MTIGLIGKKIGMTREFFDTGISVPVTVLSIEKGRILDVITKEKRGYNAIQVGFPAAGPKSSGSGTAAPRRRRFQTIVWAPTEA